jgi:hypothetical protein
MILVTVQQLLGHVSIEITLRYSHPGAGECRKAVAHISDGHHMDTTEDSVVTYRAVNSLKT